MAGTIKVDSINADSNLALKIANTAVAFIDATGLRPVAGNLNLDATATSKFYLPSANTVAIQTAGVTAVTVDSSQNVTLAGTLTTTGITNSGVATGARFNPTGSSVTGNGMYLPAANSLGLSTNGTNAVYIDSSQNVGIGVTPSATGSGKAVEIGTVGNTLWGIGAADLQISAGTYYNGSNKYAVTGSAVSAYELVAGSHRWYYAASGTAGNTATFSESMRIDSSGNLLVGTTSNTNYNSAKLAVNGNIWMDGSSTGAVIGSADNNTGSSYGALSLGASYAAGGVKDITLILQNNAGQRIYVQNRSAGVYLADGGTSWTSNSDERIKKNLVPIEDALNKVSQLRAVIGEYIDDELARKRPFLIAQDVNNVLPEAVDKTNENVWGVQYTDVIPLLVASIQELKQINDTQAETINALTARIVALETI